MQTLVLLLPLSHLPTCSPARNLVGRHGAAPLPVRKRLCGLRDRCIAAMLATQTRRSGRSLRCRPGQAVRMKHGWALARLRETRGAAAGSRTRTICLEDSHAPVQHHCRKIWSPAAVTLRAHPVCSPLRSLARSRDCCESRIKAVFQISLYVTSSCRPARLRWAPPLSDLTPRLVPCDESPRLQPKLACLPAGQRGEPNSSDENPGTGRTPVANHRRGHFQDRARQLTSSASGRAIL